jgi:hypothetical protein
MILPQAGFGEGVAQPDRENVSPIFAKRCINCHSEHRAAKGLRLDSYEAAIAGSTNGPVLVPGDAAGSELVQRLRGESVPRMPFLSNSLPQNEIDIIIRWVEAGLSDIGFK